MKKVQISLLAVVLTVLGAVGINAQSNYERCTSEGYKTMIVGKSFIALPKQNCFYEFSVLSESQYKRLGRGEVIALGSSSIFDDPFPGRRFGVEKHEEFKITGFLKIGRGKDWFKVKFISGKEAYTRDIELGLYVIVSMDDLEWDSQVIRTK